LDVHQDTPIEILHTVLLGTDKYLWHTTNHLWNKHKDKIYAIRLQSSSTDGLSIPPIRAAYITQYKNSLVGKHFKILQQVGAFHLYDDLCSEIVFKLWLANSELGAMIWYHEIENMNEYLVST
jgi:hypothetical protein